MGLLVTHALLRGEGGGEGEVEGGSEGPNPTLQRAQLITVMSPSEVYDEPEAEALRQGEKDPKL